MARQKKVGAPVLTDRSWAALNEVLRVSDEKACRELLQDEFDTGKPRKQFVLRIHSRLNRERAANERARLLDAVKRGLMGVDL